MRINYRIIALCLILLTGVVLTSAFLHKGSDSSGSTPGEVKLLRPVPSVPVQSPFPDITIAGIPDTGNCCLWQVEKKADGRREAIYQPSYVCDTGLTARGEMSIKIALSSAGLPCDQSDLIPDGSVLTAKGNVIRRTDGFAHFLGDFAIINPAGDVLFKGTIETYDRVGSHHLFFNCEACNPQSHFEGWLVGRGTDLLPNHTLRALISARGTVPSRSIPSTPLLGSISGMLIKCP